MLCYLLRLQLLLLFLVFAHVVGSLWWSIGSADFNKQSFAGRSERCSPSVQGPKLRIMLVNRLQAGGRLKQYFGPLGRPLGDLWALAHQRVWRDEITHPLEWVGIYCRRFVHGVAKKCCVITL